MIIEEIKGLVPGAFCASEEVSQVGVVLHKLHLNPGASRCAGGRQGALTESDDDGDI